MKRIFTAFATVLITGSILAQSPEAISYQAVIRDSNDQLITNTQVGMQISILQGSADGTPVYAETQTPTTNANGLISIEVGNGTTSDDFSAIDWSSGHYFLQTETDPSGGITYSITGTSQLLSVPYALFAETVGGHYVGEFYGGGVVFWVDKTGHHGLICSMIDLSDSQPWSDVALLIGITAQSDWDGLINSNAIVGQSGHTSSAAKLCLDYTNVDYGTGIYSDWYLPANDQLSLIYNSKYQVNKALDSDGNSSTIPITKTLYWSSTEYIVTGEFGGPRALISDYSLDIYPENKDDENYVRAVRTF